MSVHDRVMATAADGASRIGLAYVAYRIIRKYTTTSSALRKIREAPEVQPSDLRSILSGCDDSDTAQRDGGIASTSNSGGGKLVIVRGIVEAKSALDKANWKSLMSNNLVVSKASGEKGVIIECTETVTFILVEEGKLPNLIILSSTWKDQITHYPSQQFISTWSLLMLRCTLSFRLFVVLSILLVCFTKKKYFLLGRMLLPLACAI